MKGALPTTTVRLLGHPDLAVSGVAIATESNRPNALAPLLADRDVGLVIAGDVHETETTAYVMDAIALGQTKALLLVGSIAIEEAAARKLARWLTANIALPVIYLASPENLGEVQ